MRSTVGFNLHTYANARRSDDVRHITNYYAVYTLQSRIVECWSRITHYCVCKSAFETKALTNQRKRNQQIPVCCAVAAPQTLVIIFMCGSAAQSISFISLQSLARNLLNVAQRGRRCNSTAVTQSARGLLMADRSCATHMEDYARRSLHDR